MNVKQATLILLVFLSISSFAQDAKKMAKNLTVTPTAEFDKTNSISFDRKNPEKHGFDDISAMFKNAFVTKKFIVKDNPQYLLVMDYDYGYVIAGYRFQYSNLTAEVVDLNNNRSVVATIVYKGRFEIDSIAKAVAEELDKTIPPLNATNDKQIIIDIPKTTEDKPVTKTKEEKLVELKQFYEKQLITKEEYEAQKKKVLEE